MTKTFKKKNNSSLRKKKISVRNKSKKNRKSISKIQRIVKRKQKGGVINWEQFKDVEELDLNEVLAEDILVRQNRIEPFNLYVINNEDLRQLSDSIKQNKNLRSIILIDTILTETLYDVRGVEKELYEKTKEITKRILGILFSFKSSRQNLEINLSNLVQIPRRFVNQQHTFGFTFDTNILYEFFTINKKCKIISLNLTGWEFTIAGLYNLALLELLGKVQNNSIQLGTVILYDEGYTEWGNKIIDYNIIKNKMKEGLKKIHTATGISINTILNQPEYLNKRGTILPKEIISMFTKIE